MCSEDIFLASFIIYMGYNIPTAPKRVLSPHCGVTAKQDPGQGVAIRPVDKALLPTALR